MTSLLLTSKHAHQRDLTPSNKYVNAQEGLSFGEITKRLSTMWRDLDADERAKVFRILCFVSCVCCE